MNEPADRSHVRASDLDRENVAERLRTAAGDGRLDFDELDERLEAAYRAKTYGELEPLVADLPVSGSSAVPRPAVPAHGRSETTGMRVGGRAFGGPAVAIFGGAVRKGGWVVPRRFQAIAIFGGIEIDLREATLEDHEVTISAVALFGGVDITVPEGVAVRTSGAGIMGGFDGPNDDGGAPTGPMIHVTGVAMFGGVDVKRRPPKGTPKMSRLKGMLGHPNPPHLGK